MSCSRRRSRNAACSRGGSARRRQAPAGHAFYRYYSHLRAGRLAPGWDRDRVVAAVVAEGVPAAHGGCFEINRERAFQAEFDGLGPVSVRFA